MNVIPRHSRGDIIALIRKSAIAFFDAFLGLLER